MEANAVARIDNLEFLTDVVPRTTTYKAYKEKQSKNANGQRAYPAANISEQPANGITARQPSEPDEMEVDTNSEETPVPAPNNGNENEVSAPTNGTLH